MESLGAQGAAAGGRSSLGGQPQGLAYSQSQVAELLRDLGEYERAESMEAASLTHREALAREAVDDMGLSRMAARSRRAMAWYAWRDGRLDVAGRHLAKAREHLARR